MDEKRGFRHRRRNPIVGILAWCYLAALCWAMSVQYPPPALAGAVVIPLAWLFFLAGTWFLIIGTKGKS